MRLIDADELSKNVCAWAEDEWNAELLPYWVKEDIEVMIESAPTVEPKHGHWIYVGHGWAGESICKCSMCGRHTPDDGNYCSCCGAKMDEVKVNNSKGIDLWMTKEQFNSLYEMDEVEENG